MKLGWILGMLSYGNLAKMSLSPHSQPTSLFWLTHSFEIVLLKGTQNFPLVNVCVCVGGDTGGGTQLSQSHFILTQNTIMRPHIGHLRFSVGF